MPALMTGSLGSGYGTRGFNVLARQQDALTSAYRRGLRQARRSGNPLAEIELLNRSAAQGIQATGIGSAEQRVAGVTGLGRQMTRMAGVNSSLARRAYGGAGTYGNGGTGPAQPSGQLVSSGTGYRWVPNSPAPASGEDEESPAVAPSTSPATTQAAPSQSLVPAAGSPAGGVPPMLARPTEAQMRASTERGNLLSEAYAMMNSGQGVSWSKEIDRLNQERVAKGQAPVNFSQAEKDAWWKSRRTQLNNEQMTAAAARGADAYDRPLRQRVEQRALWAKGRAEEERRKTALYLAKKAQSGRAARLPASLPGFTRL